MRKVISHDTAWNLGSNRFGSTKSTETDLKSLVAKAVAAAMDAWEVKKTEEPKEGF